MRSDKVKEAFDHLQTELEFLKAGDGICTGCKRNVEKKIAQTRRAFQQR